MFEKNDPKNPRGSIRRAIPGTTTAASFSRRPLELTDIEVSFKRGVTSALHQRPLFLDKETITPSDATALQLQASRWNQNFSINEVIVGRAVDLVISSHSKLYLLESTRRQKKNMRCLIHSE